MIRARQLTRRLGGRTVVEDVSFEVARGEVMGFLGPNGAGKTTTLRVLAGVLPPDAGSASIGGHDVMREPLAARRQLGYAPERPALHVGMTVAALLDHAAALRDVGGRAARRDAVTAALKQTGLADVAARRIRTLSKGVRQRVGLADALVGDPPALLLDEPSAGLDPEQSAEMRRLIRALGAEHAVLVSSHRLDEVESTCDRVVVLHHGRVLADEPPARLAARLRPASRVDVEAVAPPAALSAALAGIAGVRRVDALATHNGTARCRVELEPGRDVRADLAAGIAAHGWPLLALAPVETTLEQAFLALVEAAP